MVAALIRVQDLHYAYPVDGDEPIPALNGVSLEIAEGEYLAVLGHNGSGKSTLARCLNGLLRPTRGEVWVKGLNTREVRDLLEIRATVGVVLQNPDNQFIAAVVEEELAFGPENLGIPPELLRARVEGILNLVDLVDVRRRNPRTLPAGLKARVAIAGVLAMYPKCLVLDESAAYLDPAARQGLLGLLRDLRRTQAMAIVSITHHMDEAVEADRVLVLDHGRMALEGSPAEVFTHHEQIAELGLALPPAAEVARGLARRGALSAEGIIRAEDLAHEVVRVWERAR
jgi:energy-coupling factor transport system ATP-binding protein